ncbi:unnamed protein product [Lymnaea stagnalis]|uniref:Pseudouridine synthase RsuA/RluA-like domain-containing protein n=1 Tax=Lymnaea stagnalis TaxID=6523 RepID=A0AAV2HMB9_LYMST
MKLQMRRLVGDAFRLKELVARTRKCYEKYASYGTIASKGDIPCDDLHSCNSEPHTNKQTISPDDIYSKIIFASDNIVAINKPCGISVYGKRQASTSDVGEESNKLSSTIHQYLPYLSQKLQCPEIEVGLSLKSFYSGVMLLCKSQETKKKFEKCIACAAAQKEPFMSYLVITLGVPVCPHNVPLEAYISREFLHNRELSTVSPKDIHSARKEGSMILVNFSVKPLVVNKDTATSLVEVSINKDRWEAVEVLMSHYLSPVLGDHIYSSRTYSVMGVPFSASPYSVPPSTQKVPPQILEALAHNGHFSKDEPLPLFMHRYKVTLKRFPVKKSPPLVITGAPQKEYMHALRCLGLYDPSMFL